MSRSRYKQNKNPKDATENQKFRHGYQINIKFVFW